MKRAAVAFAVLAAFGLTACSESDQVVVYKQGKYQGKPDTQSWQSESMNLPRGGGAQWTRGDRASWEAAINQRTLAQHEHKRIYNQ